MCNFSHLALLCFALLILALGATGTLQPAQASPLAPSRRPQKYSRPLPLAVSRTNSSTSRSATAWAATRLRQSM